MAKAAKRIEVRCTEQQREIIDRAVDLSGRSITDFVLDAVQDAAMKTIKEFEVMKLSARDSAALAQALLNSPEPNAALRAAAERYKTAS
jgi:uncharacterized protein (DUF1778 family)